MFSTCYLLLIEEKDV